MATPINTTLPARAATKAGADYREHRLWELIIECRTLQEQSPELPRVQQRIDEVLEELIVTPAYTPLGIYWKATVQDDGDCEHAGGGYPLLVSALEDLKCLALDDCLAGAAS